MKPSLMRRYFHATSFINDVLVAAFREREEWDFMDLGIFVGVVAKELSTPPLPSAFDDLASWVSCGFAVLDVRGEKHFVRAGRLRGGVDVRAVEGIPDEVTTATRTVSERWNQRGELLRKLGIQ